ncbi:dienelactone hydrolase family protein [Austwickia chelonae]|uniref:dienelactone hydrolase family protein n=1 Tax=Austwickia chelonae TaxID=100225 RepID=UPI000E279A0F|nr:alpha/beta hydrolase [Austwickia chelonae]
MKNRLFTVAATAALFTGLTTGSAAAAPVTDGAALATGSSTLTAYAFRPGMLKGTNVNEPKHQASLSRFEGVLAVPDKPGKHPLAVIVHGSYPNCVWYGKGALTTAEANALDWKEACGTKPPTEKEGLTAGHDYIRYPASFAYLAKHLADRGIATVVIDVSAKDMNWTGEVDARKVQQALVQEHLRLLKDFDQGKDHGVKFTSPVKGKLDFTRQAMIGHSSGGGWLIDKWTKNELPDVKAAVALQSVTSTTIPKTPTGTAPVLFLGGSCDEQARIADVQKDAKELGTANPKVPVVFADVARTTHAGLVGGFGSHRHGMVTPVDTPACATDKLLPRETMRAVNARIVGDFLTDALAGRTTYTFSASDKTKIDVKAMNSAAKVATRSGGPLPEMVAPRSVKFQEIPEFFIPELPKDVRIIPSDHSQGD